MADAATLPKPHGRSRDLTQGPILWTLLVFSLPTLGSNIVHALNGSINAVWVGRLLGETALGATTNGGLLLFLMLSGVFGFGMALTILVAQYIGRGDLDGARRAVGTGWTLFTAISLAVAALGWFFAADLLRMMGTPEAIFPLALAYIRVIFVGMPPVYLFIFMAMALRGAGDSRTPFFFIMLSAVIDVVLNPVLILGLFGMPQLGIAGAAWAMLTGQVIGGGGLLIYVYARDLPLRLRGAELAYLRPDPALLRAIVGKGLPIGLQVIVMSLSGLVMIYFVNRHGVTTTAAYGVISQLWSYVQMPAMAVGAGVSAMAAQNIGANAWDRLGRITGAGIVINTALTGLGVAVMLLLARPIMSLFLPGDPHAVEVARHINHLATWGFMLFGVTLTCFATTRAAGAVMAPLIIMTLALFPGRIGFVLAAEPMLGADAIWWSFPLGSAVMMLMAFGYYRYGNWRHAAMTGLVKPDPDEAEDRALVTAECAGQPTQPI